MHSTMHPAVRELRALAAMQGLPSLRSLARAAGVDHAGLQGALHGRRRLADATVARLAIALDASPRAVRVLLDSIPREVDAS